MADRRTALEADVVRLEAAMDACEPNHLAALVKEHRAVLSELESIPNRAEVSDADEIAARREARRAGSKSPARAKRQG